MRMGCKPNREHPVTSGNFVSNRQMNISSLARANNGGIVTRVSKFTSIPRIEPKKFNVHIPRKVSPVSKFNDLSTEKSSMGKLLFSGATSDIASRISTFVDIDSVKVAWETGLARWESGEKWSKSVEISRWNNRSCAWGDKARSRMTANMESGVEKESYLLGVQWRSTVVGMRWLANGRRKQETKTNRAIFHDTRNPFQRRNRDPSRCFVNSLPPRRVVSASWHARFIRRRLPSKTLDE